MAKARKLPSGNWRAQVYDYTDTEGKRHYESFTSDTKKEAEYKAAEFALNKKVKNKNISQTNITFEEARKKYILLKDKVLSPSTVRGYNQMTTYFKNIDSLFLEDLNQQELQNWTNEFSINHSPKTVRNAHGFIKAVLTEFYPGEYFHITLPQKTKNTLRIPSDSEISLLIAFLKENDNDMLIAVYLSAFGTLRRSEVCGLSAADVCGNTIHVHRTLIMNSEKVFVQRDNTKTVDSDRYIELPSFVIENMPKEGNIVNLTPDVITKRHQRYLTRLSIPTFRFHDLRHYAASIMHAIGIPDQYIMQRGGWSSDRVLKEIYRGTMDDYQQKFANKTNEYFAQMQHKMQHKK